MAGEVQQLREYIEQCLRDQPRASLVDTVGYFDHHNHSIPSAWRLNQAVSELTTPVALSSDGLYLEIAAQSGAVKLSDTDMSRIIEAYKMAIRAR